MWEVEKLLERRVNRIRRVEYLVRWQGWSAEHDSWVLRTKIDQKHIDEFDAHQDHQVEEHEASALTRRAICAALRHSEASALTSPARTGHPEKSERPHAHVLSCAPAMLGGDVFVMEPDHTDLVKGQRVLAYGTGPTGERAQFQATVQKFANAHPKVYVKFVASVDGNTMDILLPIPRMVRVHRSDIELLSWVPNVAERAGCVAGR